LNLLQDYVPPWDGKEIKEIIEQSLHDYQNLKFNQVFDSFEFIPLGSASIGQVHAATLHPNYYKQLQQEQEEDNKNRYKGSSKVAIKVMHRDAEDCFHYDFKIFKWLCRLALPGWKHFIHELERQMMTEFNYCRESANLQRARYNLDHSPYRDKVVIPQPIDECSSPYVLVMEYLDGIKLADAVELQLAKIFNGNRTMAKAIIRQKRKGWFINKKSVVIVVV
jgi:predicted unusual protein kinase regulating ubiquinone biosynthesis (AarF/ABC1/UbiB family)